jgi:hypothetical protein
MGMLGFMVGECRYRAMHEPLPWLFSERIGHDDMLFGGGGDYWGGVSTGCYAFGEIGNLDSVPFSSSSMI